MVEPIRELRRICQKTDNPMDSKIFFFSRRVSIYITKLLLYTPINANQTTLLSGIIGFISGFFLLFAKWHYPFIAFVLYRFSKVLDCVDGEIARYRQKTSLRGVYLDYVLHYLVDPFVLAAASVGVYSGNLNQDWILMLGMVASLGLVLNRVAKDCWHKVMATQKRDVNRTNDLMESENKSPLLQRKRIIPKLMYLFSVVSEINCFWFFFLVATALDVFLSNISVASITLNYKTIALLFYAISFPLFGLLKILYVFRKGGVPTRFSVGS